MMEKNAGKRLSLDMANGIDPGIAAFLDQLQAHSQPTRDIAVMRRAAIAGRSASGEPDGDVRSVMLATDRVTMPALLFDAPAAPDANASAGVILYFHGGGWSLLSARTHAPIMRRLAHAAQSIVIGPEIPLAPEVPFPDLLEACIAIVESVRQDPHTKVQCSKGLVIAGDSSGANLALATALRLRDTRRPMPDGLILAYGVFDSDLSRESYTLFGRAPYPLSAERLEMFWSFYCSNRADRNDHLASPLHAALAGLPPTRIVIAEQDVLRDENLALTTELARQGVAVTSERVFEATHAFWEACVLSPVSAASIAAAGTWARERLCLTRKKT
ncbi:MAG: alpha/beta hydrolase [Pseudomonadota bacterium]